MIRQPAVAGRFYPDDPDELAEAIREYCEPPQTRTRMIGAVIPHAGYIYSGHVAGAVYAKTEIPRRSIILCPNHTGMGPPLSIMQAGSWRTPLGSLAIDEELSQALIAADPYLQDDVFAHQAEHATEVQLPFMQWIAGLEIRFVPITVGTGNWARLETLGKAIAKVIRDVDSETLIIASSDMNHYESDSKTRVKDQKAIGRMLELDARGLFEVVQREKISMCGYGPASAMLVAAKSLGASKAELVKYATSGDVSGDFAHVVGYAGITVSS